MSRFLLFVGVLLTLQGCSSTSFFYNRLDFLLPWYIDSYVDLQREQEAAVDEALAPILEWHRAAELPCYVALLDHMETTVSREVTTDDISALTQEMELAWYRTQEVALNWALDFGAQLTDEQVVHFIDELMEKQDDLEDEYLERDDEEFRADSLERMEETGEDYLGRLSDQQRATMRLASEQMLRSDRLWLQERRRFIVDIAAALQRAPGWQDRIRQLIQMRTENPAPEYARVLEYNIALFEKLTVDVLNMRTERQNSYLQSELESLRGELQQLAGEPAEQIPAEQRCRALPSAVPDNVVGTAAVETAAVATVAQ